MSNKLAEDIFFSCFQQFTCPSIMQKESQIEVLKRNIMMYEQELKNYKNFESIKEILIENKDIF